MKKLNALLFFCLLVLTAQAQNRYLEPVFGEVTVTTNVPYGFNYTVLTAGIPAIAHTTRQPLICDIYQPTGDTEVKRPLILMFHTGNFLPFVAGADGFSVNGSCGGSVRDSVLVETATRLARMGYVVASCDYRSGWRPDANDPNTGQLTRVFTLINAAYRGVQDSRTAARFFRKDAATTNTFRVDPDKFTVWGVGSGGYIALATTTLDTITDTWIPKFIANIPGVGPVPMVQEGYNGNVDGTGPITKVDALYNALTGLPVGDTLCMPNHVGYDSDFQLALNLGGAMGDTSWLDQGEVPMISFHTPLDPYAPCEHGLVIVPGLNLPVVDVDGSCLVQSLVNNYGNNEVFDAVSSSDPYTVAADAINGGWDGFFPVHRDTFDSAPWEWTNGLPPARPTCNTNAVSSRLMLDTIIGYFAPRACFALGLNCNLSNIEELSENDVNLKLFPNPAENQVTIQTSEIFNEVEVFDIMGRIVSRNIGVKNNQLIIQTQNMPRGMYVAKLKFDNGFISKRFILK
ncbi:MAG: T9SS type A sorting domain-containing protein [Saprospiraceae bacterium]|nr:T9SS type A sorting domain-containing protein [Saprospiraceae bacterium]MBP7680061.1 T9SS type A sorting domain-containing protein [Saprospiraceae bacterium]